MLTGAKATNGTRLRRGSTWLPTPVTSRGSSALVGRIGEVAADVGAASGGCRGGW